MRVNWCLKNHVGDGLSLDHGNPLDGFDLLKEIGLRGEPLLLPGAEILERNRGKELEVKAAAADHPGDDGLLAHGLDGGEELLYNARDGLEGLRGRLIALVLAPPLAANLAFEMQDTLQLRRPTVNRG